jgi:hypothetical protein
MRRRIEFDDELEFLKFDSAVVNAEHAKLAQDLMRAKDHVARMAVRIRAVELATLEVRAVKCQLSSWALH